MTDLLVYAPASDNRDMLKFDDVAEPSSYGNQPQNDREHSRFSAQRTQNRQRQQQQQQVHSNSPSVAYETSTSTGRPNPFESEPAPPRGSLVDVPELSHIQTLLQNQQREREQYKSVRHNQPNKQQQQPQYRRKQQQRVVPQSTKRRLAPEVATAAYQDESTGYTENEHTEDWKRGEQRFEEGEEAEGDGVSWEAQYGSGASRAGTSAHVRTGPTSHMKSRAKQSQRRSHANHVQYDVSDSRGGDNDDGLASDQYAGAPDARTTSVRSGPKSFSFDRFFSENKFVLIATIIVIALVGICAFYFFKLQKEEKKDKQQSERTREQTDVLVRRQEERLREVVHEKQTIAEQLQRNMQHTQELKELYEQELAHQQRQRDTEIEQLQRLQNLTEQQQVQLQEYYDAYAETLLQEQRRKEDEEQILYNQYAQKQEEQRQYDEYLQQQQVQRQHEQPQLQETGQVSEHVANHDNSRTSLPEQYQNDDAQYHDDDDNNNNNDGQRQQEESGDQRVHQQISVRPSDRIKTNYAEQHQEQDQHNNEHASQEPQPKASPADPITKKMVGGYEIVTFSAELEPESVEDCEEGNDQSQQQQQLLHAEQQQQQNNENGQGVDDNEQQPQEQQNNDNEEVSWAARLARND